MNNYAWYALAAIAEIAGCYSAWASLRLGKSRLWLIPGLLALALFAFALTRIQTSGAGRAYAAYGGVYIVASLMWLWIVEGIRPDLWDTLGAAICVAGSCFILLGPRNG